MGASCSFWPYMEEMVLFIAQSLCLVESAKFGWLPSSTLWVGVFLLSWHKFVVFRISVWDHFVSHLGLHIPHIIVYRILIILYMGEVMGGPTQFSTLRIVMHHHTTHTHTHTASVNFIIHVRVLGNHPPGHWKENLYAFSNVRYINWFLLQLQYWHI